MSDGTVTLDAIDPGCNSTMARHRCVRGAGHAGLHYDHDGCEWADRHARPPVPIIEGMTALYEEWVNSAAHLYEGCEYGTERAAFYAGFAAALRPDGEPRPGEEA